MTTCLHRRRCRRICVAVILVGVAGLGYLSIGAIRMPGRQQSEVAPAKDLLAVEGDQLARTLAEFLAVPSYSFDDRSGMDPKQFQQLHAILEQRFSRAHALLEQTKINDLGLLYRWPGSDPSLDPILLMSHLDVVGVESTTRSEWEHDPHDGAIANGFVWGRGALDVKSGVIAIMAAVEALIDSGFEPSRSILLAFGQDEEVGGDLGNATIAKQLADRGQRLHFVLDEGGAILDGIIPGVNGPVAFVAIAEKGIARMKLTVHGQGGHGSMPGQNAAYMLARAVDRIDQQPMPARLPPPTRTLMKFLGPEMPFSKRLIIGNLGLFEPLVVRQFAASPTTDAVVRSTINVTYLSTVEESSTEGAVNVSPKVGTALLDVRLLPGEAAEAVRDHIERICGDLRRPDGSAAVKCEIVSAVMSDTIARTDNDTFDTLQRTIHQVFPETVVAAGLTSVSTDSRWYFPIADDVYRFIPMRFGPDDVERLHGINERIAVDNLVELVQFYGQLIRNGTTKRS